ncbi:MAG: IS1 family transposase [Candidatus Helarchaeota archaeon]|nr:IS1 family transposase [Candidatus Helarchaeota archaeon]
MNQLPLSKRVQILQMLCEGSSMRSISRVVDVSINTVAKLLVDAGRACAEYQDQAFHNLNCKRIQCDEVWSFCYAKEKNVPKDKKGQFGYGDVWTFTGMDAESKLLPSFVVGNRDAATANAFIADLASRLAKRVQLTTDGNKVYLEAVEGAFGGEVDYAMLVKMYESTQEETRYSPARCTGCKGTPITGNPDRKYISTSFVERQNLNIRMGMRRYTRLTNAFSKKIENHCHALAIYFMFYNFVRIHQTLRMTPAMKAGVTDHLWSVEEIAGLLS